ncbi:MAG: hypothetical protein PUB69_06175 [Desulfovibrionaceae bacterium]|nr:hypothetical protein [Desulfovibrionaceae bacterium]
MQKDGTVNLEGFPELRLFREVQDDSLRSQYIRQNLNVPMLDPAKAGELSIDGLKTLISNNLRRKPASRQSKDTKQSVYYCVFKDCPSHENEWIQDPSRYRGLKILRERHADINAAINIGRRFLNDGSIIKDNGNSK